ncbi:ATP-dependent helicase [Proteiniphilum saccharofermentans]|jgi:DNA helicase-2/ATP-dependent DNA helicase PcrA|uniref:ATP-dependent helicase n=1 Tax=Proteiniphilum saccharofermentans TaxID=1642647 RepID=UPI0028AD1A45|nr:ATP-dependent helicase [Proteiniphilum saccharofermentans]
MTPTRQQELILEHEGNAVIIAAPGSGKTFVVSEKIKDILSNLNEFEGVVAISYTNKASNELKGRSLKNGINPKNSFFGTIDSFFISEIIIPFGKQIFGIPKKQIEVLKIDGLSSEEAELFEWASRELQEEELSAEYISLLKRYFLNGILLMETLGVLGNYIFSKSKACQNYIKSRYKNIFIDEYQDSGINQHTLFLRIVKLGVIGVAVGDLNQSIYKFSGKDSRFLSELSENKDFKVFPLNKNHRCHDSIINYSNYLLNPKSELIKTSDSRVFFSRIEGNEVAIANWINGCAPKVKPLFKVDNNSKIAILTRTQRTANVLNENITIPHRLSITTELDNSLNIWSGIFTNLLHFAFDKNFKFIEVIEVFSSFENFTKQEIKTLISLKNEIKILFAQSPLDIKLIINSFVKVAKIIAPNSPKGDSVKLLTDILNNELLLNSYYPANEDEVCIMTLHKSKGLEFDVVFHLDLYEWILPLKSPGENNDWDNPVYSDWVQDINLHYVGITRARKACILVSSTQRTNSTGANRRGADSEFLSVNGIEGLRYKNNKP